MKYQKIFWLEDTPHMLGEILRICAGCGVDKDSLFARTTFAPDYQSGAEIVRAKEFDLYILDGDFPEATSKEWKSRYWDLVQQVSSETTYLKFEDKYGDGYIGRSTNNFSRFFSEFLQTKAGKTIVYSVSTIAPKVAFYYGLSFYSKALEKDMIKSMVTENIDNERFFARYVTAHITPKSLDFLDQWEYGSRFDLVERYLL